jgi:hypothetical protein
MTFNRPVVENTLTEHEVSGRDYLEKIVQVGFDIPAIKLAEVNPVV